MNRKFRENLLTNVDLFILIVEVLDTEFYDSLIRAASTIDPSSESSQVKKMLANIRFSNLFRGSYVSDTLLLKDLSLILKSIYTIVNNIYYLNIITFILTSICSYKGLNSQVIQLFFRKYRFYFRIKMRESIVGQDLYSSDNCLNQIAIVYLYLLYISIKKKNIYCFIDMNFKFSFLSFFSIYS
uniref:hypothetical protein n=1 Tax=Madagascaria erythrocladioides TaxID=753684 RepID=UPI001BEDC324|nr:hypothetical protein MW574_pgp066 [Madagascaria erythrocladioides]QUE29046.1 hypothetical protein [Madagascaria erythrocladioides]UNJ16601.1 hypothetical protein [Madagascaria erythrocladioides]